MKKNNIVCVYPVWLNHGGHETSFYKIFLKLSKKIKKKIFFLVPENNILKEKKLEKILKHISSGYFSLLLKIMWNTKSLIKFYKKNNIKYESIFFIDGYSFDFLLSFMISIILKSKCPTIFIYCRYNYEGKKLLYFKIFIKIIKNFSNIKILTDNKKLYLKIKKIYQVPVLEVPVPHTNFSKKIIKKTIIKKKINLYFPGVFREEKFGRNLHYFLENNNHKKYVVKINNNFKNNKKYNFKTILLNKNLSRKEYLGNLRKSDLIVLPYQSNQYEYRTSGVFFEAISMQKKVLVSDKTWMSRELSKHGLKDFIVHDWKKFDLNKSINLIQSKKNYFKLLRMKNIYIKYHNENNFVNLIIKKL